MFPEGGVWPGSVSFVLDHESTETICADTLAPGKGTKQLST